MKLNKILMVLAASAFVACSSDDLSDFGTKQAPEDSRLVQLDQNFVIAGVGEEGNVTRTHWEQNAVTKAIQNKFLPIYEIDGAADDILDNVALLEAEAVGLCWLGQVPGAEVYTNYQFYHFGWLNNGETEAKFDCGDLTNGSLYSDVTLKNATVADSEAKPADWGAAGLKDKSKKDGEDNLNYNSGVYRTDNKAIFGGDYIVYYPFNPDFKDAGTIPAVAETKFNPASTEFTTPEIGYATFRYSSPVTIEGGDQAADFGMYNLSALVQLKVYAPDGDAAIGNRKVDQIVLYSASEKLLKQANLAADMIVAGKKGAELYASSEGTKTISAKFAGGEEVLLAKKADAAKGAFITVLPTTVEDLKVLVHSTDGLGDDGKWATIDMANTEFKAGSAQVLNISVANADWKADYIAVDEASLTTALTEARAVVDADHPATITVIGDITLESAAYNINNVKDKWITITGDDIIVPEDVTLTVKTNMESDIRVLGKSCCTGAKGGRLYISGGTISNVTMEETEAKVTTEIQYDDYNPYVAYLTGGDAATVAAGKTIDVQAGRVAVRKAVQHKGNITIAEGAKVTVEGIGDLNFMGGSVDNFGTIEVMKNGKFDMTDANGNANANDGERMTNEETGVFIHNVDAGVGTAVQSMTQNGEYRCRVDEQIKLDDAFLQWTACSVIEMVNPAAYSYDLGTAANITPTAYKHNGEFIDIEVNSGALTTFTKAAKDNKEINIGNLTVTDGGLDINFVKVVDGTTTYQRKLIVNGDMDVAANTTMTASKKISITGDLTVEGATLTYKGEKANVEGLAITGGVTVSGATFDADEVDAINITCDSFSLEEAGIAKFGNRTGGGDKNLVVSGAITNPEGCQFLIHAANQNGAGSVLAWVTCTQLNVGGTFSAARPRVVAPETPAE